jgi:hypothetical protein
MRPHVRPFPRSSLLPVCRRMRPPCRPLPPGSAASTRAAPRRASARVVRASRTTRAPLLGTAATPGGRSKATLSPHLTARSTQGPSMRETTPTLDRSNSARSSTHPARGRIRSRPGGSAARLPCWAASAKSNACRTMRPPTRSGPLARECVGCALSGPSPSSPKDRGGEGPRRGERHAGLRRDHDQRPSWPHPEHLKPVMCRLVAVATLARVASTPAIFTS